MDLALFSKFNELSGAENRQMLRDRAEADLKFGGNLTGSHLFVPNELQNFESRRDSEYLKKVHGLYFSVY
jgi:hypothetical protein